MADDLGAGAGLPRHLGADGLPIGVQFIGARFAENVILDAAQAVEDRARMRAFLEHRTAKITR